MDGLPVNAALRAAAPLLFATELIDECLDPSDPADGTFRHAWQHGIGTLDRRARNAIAGITGHLGESVAEMLLDQLDWNVLWHFPGPGRHGVDLVMLSPDTKVIAVEVKTTLVPGRIPRLARRDITQMSTRWIDGPDNPGMSTYDLTSDDIFGAVTAVNLSDLTWRAALTDNFDDYQPVTSVGQLHDLTWLETPRP